MTPARELQYVSAPVIMAACLAACSQQAPPAEPANFDSCLITHMAAIAMLGEFSDDTDADLLEAVITSQNELLQDDKLDADDLGQRTSTLMRAYSGAADTSFAEAKANGTPPQTLAAKAVACGKALAQ